MFLFTNNSPGVYLLKLFAILILLAISLFTDFLLLASHPWVELVWALPILAAAVLVGPLEILGVGLFALILSLAVASSEGGHIHIWTAVSIIIFSLLTAALAHQLRQTYTHANVVREALNDSPLVFAELSFPGYRVIKHNESFLTMTGTDITPGEGFIDRLPADSGERLSQLLDQAVAERQQMNDPEFRINRPDGGGSFWNVSAIPVAATGRSTPHSVTLFGSDVTESVQRASTRDAALKISTSVMSNLDLEVTVAVALESLVYIADTEGGVLFLLQDEQWTGMAGYGYFDDAAARKLRLPCDDMPILDEAIQSRRTITFSDVTAADVKGLERLGPVRSVMAIPLITGKRRVGAVLCLQKNDVRSFSAEQTEFATVVGAQVALAIENASIYDNEISMRKSLEAIESVSEAGLVSLDLEEILIELVTRTQDVMQMDAAMILLADEDREFLELRTAAGSVAQPVSQDKIRIGEGLAGKAFKHGGPMKIDNIADYEREMCPFAADSGIRSVLAVPLRMGGRTAGVLQVGSKKECAFTAREWGLIQVLADRASQAVQNSILHEETRDELARVALLRDVAAACAGSENLELIAFRALEAIYEQLACEIASIYLLDHEENALVNLAFLGHSHEITREIRTIPLDRRTYLVQSVLGKEIITHDTHPTDDASPTERKILEELNALEIRRAALPIIYRGEVVGGMALAMPGDKPFSRRELETFKSITDQLAVAFGNALFTDSTGIA